MAASYRLTVIPDTVLSDGTVLHGQLTSFDQLRSRRDAVWLKAKEVLEAAAHANRGLTWNEQQRWDMLYAELHMLDGMIEVKTERFCR